MDNINAKKGVLSVILSRKGNFSLEDFVETLQGFSLGLRHRHWETRNFAAHKATEQIQDSLDGLIDDFVEAYVGFTKADPKFKKTVAVDYDSASVISCLKSMDLTDSSLLNIRDEILSAVYKLQYLERLS